MSKTMPWDEWEMLGRPVQNATATRKTRTIVLGEDGQTPAPGETTDPDEADEPTRRANGLTGGAAAEGNDAGPGAGVCPCKSHGDPDGDCGEDCA